MSNRLLNESSPYLRQHAHNPVDWYPWGSEAFSRARSLNRPILLSVGYSACHWCHVMEHESFDNVETAELMNAHFVCVKVDREERPDVDHTYQRVVQLMGRSGGWPLTVFLTPALEPFYAGTYFPPVERYGMPSFRTVLHALHDAYTNRSSEVSESAREITEALRTLTEASGEPADPPKDFLVGAAEKLARRMDPLNGGFGSAPKFPNTMNLDVLLLASRGGHSEYAERVMTTLRHMRAGGIYDQLGGGFHRYSTDAEWLVPHFEKMLYDNALLARVFTDAAILTGDAAFAETVRDTLRYVEREMTSPDGAFYSTQDADSEGEEGKFFVWTPPELASELGADDARMARVVFTVPEGGNFEHGASIFTRHVSDADAARELGLSPDLVRESMSRVREKLFHARERREKPFRDEKILATWNGLMISAFAHAGGSFAEAHFVEVAARALEFVREHLWRSGNLLRVSKDGVAKIDAFLDDYADMANAALDVHQATLDERALVFANALVEAALAHFWDEASQTFYYTRAQQPDTLMRISDVYDHAVPSGVSSICHALLRLHALTDDVRFLERAEVTLRRYSESALSNPFGFGNLLCAMARYMEGPTEIVVVGDRNRADTQELLAAARSEYVPFRSISCVAPGGAGARTGIPTHQHEGKATAYVCVNRACSLPIVSEEQLRAALRSAAVSSPN